MDGFGWDGWMDGYKRRVLGCLSGWRFISRNATAKGETVVIYNSTTTTITRLLLLLLLTGIG